MTDPETLLGHLLVWTEIQPEAPLLRVAASGVDLSYAQVARLVAGCSRELREEGVRPGDRVYLALENDWTWVVGLLAAEAIGAIAVAGNTRLSPHETALMLRNCQPSVVLADEWQAPKVPSELGFKTVMAAEISPASDELTPGDPHRPAAIAYSSGTSGEPKGVLLDAASMTGASKTYARLFASSPETRTAIAVPLFHNTGFIDGLGHALVAGGAVDLLRRFDPATIAGGIASGRLTFFIGVPAMLRRIADLPLEPVEGVTPWIAYGGAPMSPATAEAFLRTFPGARMSNVYGLSEATSLTHYLPADQSFGRWDAIGVAVPGTRDHVVDDELFVDSPTRMLGYWDARTQAAAPVELLDSAWMSTGDIVTRGDDGLYRVLGRKDGLINRGGEKISPREVESALCAFPEVVEAVVVGLPDRVLGSVPAAQLVLSAGEQLDEKALRAHLSDRLADYKIPVRFDVVAELARNASGKVHLQRVRQALTEGHQGSQV